MNRVLGVIAVLFGLVTLKEGASVLFFEGAARAAAGHYVPFVLWFNWLAGFAYVAAGIGLLRGSAWAPRLAAVLAAATLLVFAALGVHIATGEPYEIRTVAAMTLRSLFWCGVALSSRRSAGPPSRMTRVRSDRQQQAAVGG